VIRGQQGRMYRHWQLEGFRQNGGGYR
jgi:hypothetical protein